jgi:DNA adenine methylase
MNKVCGKFQPIIKWSGSKRSQAKEIIQYFPQQIDTYYEPFCGGCSMMRMLLDSDISVKKIVCSDLNGDLISLWNKIKNCPDEIMSQYKKMWTELNSTSDVDVKRKYFEQKRDEYNKTHNPFIFFFIMRTTTNGMPRYNKNGEFNNSFHLTRNGITPDNLQPILQEWSEKLNKVDIEFRHCSYEDIFSQAKINDFLYLDPPYFNTKGMYFGGLDFDKFFSELSKLKQNNIKFIMSFDGKSGNVDNTCNVPTECYNHHLYIKSGNSSFKRTIGKDSNAMVYESLYLSYDEETNLW